MMSSIPELIGSDTIIFRRVRQTLNTLNVTMVHQKPWTCWLAMDVAKWLVSTSMGGSIVLVFILFGSTCVLNAVEQLLHDDSYCWEKRVMQSMLNNLPCSRYKWCFSMAAAWKGVITVREVREVLLIANTDWLLTSSKKLGSSIVQSVPTVHDCLQDGNNGVPSLVKRELTVFV